jgi:hypothetical protein
MKHKIFLFLLLLLIVSCSNSEDSESRDYQGNSKTTKLYRYVNNDLNYSLELPETWRDKIHILYSPIPKTDIYSYRPDPDSIENMKTVFTIRIEDIGDLVIPNMDDEIALIKEIEKVGSKHYKFTYFKKNPYNEITSPTEYNEYREIQSFTNQIINTFQILNKGSQ